MTTILDFNASLSLRKLLLMRSEQMKTDLMCWEEFLANGVATSAHRLRAVLEGAVCVYVSEGSGSCVSAYMIAFILSIRDTAIAVAD
ncbi:hypothetical protein KIN20_035656 [Parelaphostrongylus tenuis]|uniref:Uncharacterized protein n=1 Tax=Parelaphostrongylus tenuis TaxID=148309 RepID=A0AAD5WKQ3_PARTN|nr:hypothetical protein KIN20_035656 [Parelaphostrongylus tenuis]